jgi:hypothetical protein
MKREAKDEQKNQTRIAKAMWRHVDDMPVKWSKTKRTHLINGILTIFWLGWIGYEIKLTLIDSLAIISLHDISKYKEH